MNSRPIENNKEIRRKKNNSVTTLPFVKLSQSTMLPQTTPITSRNENAEPKKDNNPPKPEEKKPTEKKEGKKIPNFKKFERRVSDKNLEYKGKLEMTENNDNENNNDNKKKRSRIVKFDEESSKKEPRKKSIGTIRNRKSEKNLLKNISRMTFIQYSEALSTAGRDDDGKIKTNQDSYVLERNINGVLNFNIFGVLDGHGVNGHFASQFVTRYIINRIKNHSLLKSLDNPKNIYNKLKSNNFQIITNIFLDADLQIRKQEFNVEMSGTTAVLVIELDEHIICANTGDSRAILIYDDSNDKNLSNTKIFNLSNDAKPDLPNEKKRIYECGGVVEQVIDETDETVGPYRIWIKGETYPGLAISRTIGDSDAKKIGVIANPEFIEYTITPQTKYIIACSDGIWEFLKNEEVMEIANQFYLKSDPAGLCRELTKRSTTNWLKEDVVVDDITVVTAFF
jgi:serine/threonine protein phosphatase PrpC